MLNYRVDQLMTQRPGRSARGTRVHWAKRLAIILRPSLALRHPWPPDLPSRPYLPKGAEGARERCSAIVSVN
jgi:hypothetical protein